MSSTGRLFSALIAVGFALCAHAHAAPRTAALRADFERALAEFDEAQRIQLDRPGLGRQLFRSAAQGFSSIIATGVVNGRLEYNLANCYLQAGHVGQAIVHYRRAQRLIPADEALANNLRVARSRCLTNIQPTRRSAFLKSVFFWHYQTSVASRARTAILAYVAAWILLILRGFGLVVGLNPTVGRGLSVPAGEAAGVTFQPLFPRRAMTAAVVICAMIAATAGVSVGMTRWFDRNAPEGVVTSMDVAVYKGPGPGYQRQFEQPLQPGVEFTLREQRGEWCEIELADGKVGWIEVGQTQLIPNGRV